MPSEVNVLEARGAGTCISPRAHCHMLHFMNLVSKGNRNAYFVNDLDIEWSVLFHPPNLYHLYHNIIMGPYKGSPAISAPASFPSACYVVVE